MVIILVIIIVIVVLLAVVIVIDVYHPDQPAGLDRVAGNDVLTDDHLLSLKAACVMITNDHILTLKAASNEH